MQVFAGAGGLICALLALTDFCGVLKKGLGSEARTANECRSGLLLTGGSIFGGLCTKKCVSESDCGRDLRCIHGDCAPRGEKRSGEACSVPWECESGSCGLPFGNSLNARGLVCE